MPSEISSQRQYATLQAQTPEDFADSGKEQKPFRIENVVSAPKLFMGIGAFIWIPLSLAIGRRPVFLLCNVILFLFTILAASARTFHQLLISICFQGLAQGAGTSLVSHLPSYTHLQHPNPTGLPHGHRYHIHSPTATSNSYALVRRRVHNLYPPRYYTSSYQAHHDLAHIPLQLGNSGLALTPLGFFLLPRDLLHPSTSCLQRPYPRPKRH